MKMKADIIIDGMGGKEIKGAVCQCMYHGWLVSLSQVFPRASVAIFKGDKELYNLPNVEFAIEKIDKLNKLNNAMEK